MSPTLGATGCCGIRNDTDDVLAPEFIVVLPLPSESTLVAAGLRRRGNRTPGAVKVLAGCKFVPTNSARPTAS